MGANVQLPYPMQLGSGTVDLMPGVTVVGEAGDWSWGAQTIVTLRLGENDRDYTLGNRIDGTAWIGRALGDSFTATLRLAGADWGSIDGADGALNPNMVPTADPDRRAGNRFDALLGIDWTPGGSYRHRLGVELGVPFHQRLDGPQLETDTTLTVGWQYTP